MNAVRVFVRRLATRSEPPSIPQPTVIFNGKKYTRTAVPQSFTGMFVHNNWKAQFEQEYMFRYMCYSFPIVFLFCVWITGKVKSPANKAYWTEKRKHDDHMEHLAKDPYYDFLHPKH